MVTIRTVLIATTASAAMLAAAPAAASVAPSAVTLSCANGKSYSLVPRAVTVTGDIVTGRLYGDVRRGVPVRLVPMGAGYRYAGRGIWLDGVRNEAVLNFSTRQAITCEVEWPSRLVRPDTGQ
ncbi:hypothetical protein RA307_22315 [Xanthobacteraceae bacterium Astr-EGSB]|uniref:hypothetical protein n=1 Tax=Astrobacterium formosum TaxID=3069710 RepID=UPI0027B6BE61|nr:hypothetical protein [Xanthobacteraceae bacterium Astr-EGSB]